MPAGVIETRDSDLLIRFVEERQSVVELENVAISGVAGGAEIRLRDIGRIVDTFSQAEDQSLLGQQRTGLLKIKKTKNQDTIRVADAVRSFVKRERERFPQVTLAITQDSSTLVRQRLQLLTRNGWQGMLLVFFTLWLFFNAKLSFWVVMSLPVSFFGAFFFLPLLGQTINMMTMVAFLLALGLLMDDGIVIAENVARHLSLGKSSMRAAVDGVCAGPAGVVVRVHRQGSTSHPARSDSRDGDQPDRSVPDSASPSGALAARRECERSGTGSAPFRWRDRQAAGHGWPLCCSAD